MGGLTDLIINVFGDITNAAYGREILVFVISMLPFLELRGGILAAALLDMNGLSSFIICLIGNILVIPIALLLLEFIFKLLRKINKLDKTITKFENKCLSKREQLDKYGYWGLLLFIGIPIPGTGAWTGCFLASLLGMDKKKSFIAAMGGVIMSAVIMQVLSFGILKNIF